MSRCKLPITAIIINYNSNNFLSECLDKIHKSSHIPSEIIIVDNNSRIKPINVINEFNSSFKNILSINFVSNSQNIGFARAVNQAIKSSKNNYLLLINPDFFVDKNAISQIWEVTISKSRVAAVGGKLLKTSNRKMMNSITNKPNIFTLLVEFTSLNKVFKFFGFKNMSNFWDIKSNNCKKIVSVNSTSGCFMLINKKWYKKVGGFDDKFFIYLEDLDFCLRILEQGGKIYFNPNSFGYHVGGGSSIKKPNKINQTEWDKSKRYFTKKHFPKTYMLLNLIYQIDDFVVKLIKLLK